MNSITQPPVQGVLTWQEDCARLLARPFRVSDNLNREGRMIGLRVLSVPHAEPGFVDIALALFPLWLSPPKEEERVLDHAALQVFLAGLQSTDFRDRLSACTALGHLGDEAAREALQAASKDEHRFVRAAAERALTALALPRIAVEAFVGKRLFLQQQVQQQWKPLAIVEVDQRGEARFVRIPSEATCRLLMLSGVRQEATFKVKGIATRDALFGQLAAAGEEPKTSDLPRSYRLPLEDGTLQCTVYRDDDGKVIVAFRSDAPQLQNQRISVEIADGKTQKTQIRTTVTLEPDAQGILTGKLELDRLSEFTEEHEIKFGPLLDLDI